jgi:ATP synthase protein I
VQPIWRGVGRYSTVGLEFALSVLIGLFAGRWLDQKLGTGGWLTVIGLGFGVAAGYRTIYRALKQANQEAEKQEREEREARSKYHDHED